MGGTKTMTTQKLTDKEVQALNALRREQESFRNDDNGAKGNWASVYLDNAKPSGWDGKTRSGVLGSLANKGLYREDDGFAFGEVLM